MKNNWTNIGTGRIALAAVLVATIGGAFAQGNGNNQPSGQAGGTGTTNVVVTNTAAQPVPVKEQNNPDLQQPFTFTAPYSIQAGIGYAQIQLPPVPAGKRWIIQQVSANAYVQGGTGVMMSLKLDIFNGAKYIPTFMPMTYVGAGDFMPSSVYDTVQQVRMAADPSAQPSWLWVVKSRDINYGLSGTVIGDVSVTGYLVNIP